MIATLLLATGAAAQAQGAKPAAPAGNAPAAKASPANGPAVGSTAPAAANAPAAVPGPAAATAGAKTLAVRVPSGGEYQAYIQEATSAAPKAVTDKADLEVPAGRPTVTVYVLDLKSGYAARKSVETKALPPELSFASPDFNLVQKVRILATGKEGKPIAQGTVTLTDSGNNTTRGIIQASSVGVAEFSFVKSGQGTVGVTAGEGADSTTTTKTISVDLPKGETAQSVTIELPGVTNVIASAPAAAGTPEPKPAETPGATAPAVAPAPAPTAPAVAPAAAPEPVRSGQSLTDTIGNFIIGLIQFAILIGLLVGGYLYLKKRGVTIESALKSMGVQPETVGAGGTNLSGANLSSSVAGPGPAPAPPPVVADPNQCQFCGQMKDGAGNCGCMVTPGQRAGGGAVFGGGGPVAGSGPRLVGMSGPYMGQIFPINGAMVIGRDPMNPIPLDRDTTTSRRHAQITGMGGSFQLQDLGSSNGTFVNGSRVTDVSLTPGDEVLIGGTRFRFEV
jgi:hypothetical protein